MVAIITGSSDREPRTGTIEHRECLQDEVDSLVSLQSSHVCEQWTARSRAACRGEELSVHSIMDDTNGFARNSPRREIVRSALTDRLERTSLVHQRNSALGNPY